MTSNQKNLFTRIYSALAAVLVLAGAVYFGGVNGTLVACCILILLGTMEFAQMAFADCPISITALFAAAVFILLACLYTGPSTRGFAGVAGSLAFFYVGALWLARGRMTNENLLANLGKGTFGLVYCVLFPSYCLWLVRLTDGLQWFVFLLVVVFFGDTFAYFGGRWRGRRKLMPEVSPNKTWEGAVSGLAGSALAGTFHATSVFQEVPRGQILAFCLVCGVAAQSGDLLVSLVKRVFHVKDAGKIMPGHGGILDRLDGVYIACPLVYLFALYVRPGG